MTELLIYYAMRFIGVPYKWGGSNPISGFDCSGFVQECLIAVGFFDSSIDRNAQILHDYFKDNDFIISTSKGSIAFYGKSIKEIKHIAIMVDNSRIIEAGAGGPEITDKQHADLHNAFIRIRPLKYRKDFLIAYSLDKDIK